MSVACFRVGDRVRARTSGFVPQGMVGIIHRILSQELGYYYVLFDEVAEVRLMHTRDLERTDESPRADALRDPR